MLHSRAWSANHTQPHLVLVVGDNDLLVGGGCPHAPWPSYQQLHAINTKADIHFCTWPLFNYTLSRERLLKRFTHLSVLRNIQLIRAEQIRQQIRVFCFDSTLSAKWCTFLTSRSSNETGRLMTHCRCCVRQTIRVRSLSAHLGVNVSRK